MTRISDPERLLEEQLKGAGIPYEREYWFHPTRKWRADFIVANSELSLRMGNTVWPPILIEVEGGVWLPKGGHTTGSGFTNNCEKYNAAAELGYRVLRYTPAMIEDGSALAQIQRVLGL